MYDQLLFKIKSWANQKVFCAVWYSLSIANQETTFKKVAVLSSAKLQELKFRNVVAVPLLRCMFFQENQEMQDSKK